jgi:hypothetical protein
MSNVVRTRSEVFTLFFLVLALLTVLFIDHSFAKWGSIR